MFSQTARKYVLLVGVLILTVPVAASGGASNIPDLPEGLTYDVRVDEVSPEQTQFLEKTAFILSKGEKSRESTHRSDRAGFPLKPMDGSHSGELKRFGFIYDQLFADDNNVRFIGVKFDVTPGPQVEAGKLYRVPLNYELVSHLKIAGIARSVLVTFYGYDDESAAETLSEIQKDPLKGTKDPIAIFKFLQYIEIIRSARAECVPRPRGGLEDTLKQVDALLAPVPKKETGTDMVHWLGKTLTCFSDIQGAANKGALNGLVELVTAPFKKAWGYLTNFKETAGQDIATVKAVWNGTVDATKFLYRLHTEPTFVVQTAKNLEQMIEPHLKNFQLLAPNEKFELLCGLGKQVSEIAGQIGIQFLPQIIFTILTAGAGAETILMGMFANAPKLLKAIEAVFDTIRGIEKFAKGLKFYKAIEESLVVAKALKATSIAKLEVRVASALKLKSWAGASQGLEKTAIELRQMAAKIPGLTGDPGKKSKAVQLLIKQADDLEARAKSLTEKVAQAERDFSVARQRTQDAMRAGHPLQVDVKSMQGKGGELEAAREKIATLKVAQKNELAAAHALDAGNPNKNVLIRAAQKNLDNTNGVVAKIDKELESLAQAASAAKDMSAKTSKKTSEIVQGFYKKAPTDTELAAAKKLIETSYEKDIRYAWALKGQGKLEEAAKAETAAASTRDFRLGVTKEFDREPKLASESAHVDNSRMSAGAVELDGLKGIVNFKDKWQEVAAALKGATVRQIERIKLRLAALKDKWGDGAGQKFLDELRGCQLRTAHASFVKPIPDELIIIGSQPVWLSSKPIIQASRKMVPESADYW